MRPSWLFAFALLTGCYSPDVTAVHYSCTAANPICPDGTSCISDVCLAPGEPVPPAPPPPGVVPGCRAGNGTELASGVWACPGQFAPSKTGTPTASKLCADKYAICTQAGAADLGLCKMLPGFFAANTLASVFGNNYNQASCGKLMAFQSQLFVGCGTTAGNKGFTIAACSGFTQVLNCSSGNDGWNCGNGSTTLDGVTNTNDGDGVVCCASG